MDVPENPFADSPALKDATRELIVERFRARGAEPTVEQVDELMAVLDEIVNHAVAEIHSHITPMTPRETDPNYQHGFYDDDVEGGFGWHENYGPGNQQ